MFTNIIVELAAIIGRDARDVAPSDAMDYVDGRKLHYLTIKS
jgi:hypothetical protein